MSNALIKMRTGTITKLQEQQNNVPVVPLDEGTVYFAVNTTDHVGKIVYDAPDGNNGIDRIVMSTRAEAADFSSPIGANSITYFTDTKGTFGSFNSNNGALYATEENGSLHWGTLPVAQGGTGVASFTTDSIIMSGNSATAALTTRGVTDNTSNTVIVNNTNIPTMNTIYYGLVTVNGNSQTRATGIYAPTGTGTAGQILVSTGNNTKTPAWKTLKSHSYTPEGTIKVTNATTTVNEIAEWVSNTPTAVTPNNVVTSTSATAVSVANEVLTIPASVLTSSVFGASASVTAGTSASLTSNEKTVGSGDASYAFVGTQATISHTIN